MKYILAHNNNLPEKLTKLRYQTRPYLTQKELAKNLRTNQTEISRIENGDYPKIDTFISYCRFYKISADELLKITPENEIVYLD